MNTSFTLAAKVLATAGVVAAAAVPALSFAQTYAYVNQQGEVRTVDAVSAQAALTSAPSIDEHSGVMLLTNPSDGIVGDTVKGV